MIMIIIIIIMRISLIIIIITTSKPDVRIQQSIVISNHWGLVLPASDLTLDLGPWSVFT